MKEKCDIRLSRYPNGSIGLICYTHPINWVDRLTLRSMRPECRTSIRKVGIMLAQMVAIKIADAEPDKVKVDVD
jgi:hypothetical protein